MEDNDSDIPKNPNLGEVFYSKVFHEWLYWNGRDWIGEKVRNHESRKQDILRDFESDSDLYNEVMAEMRKRKIKKLKR